MKTLKTINQNIKSLFAKNESFVNDLKGIMFDVDEFMTQSVNDYTLWRNLANLLDKTTKAFNKKEREFVFLVKTYINKHTLVSAGKKDEQGNRYHIVTAKQKGLMFTYVSFSVFESTMADELKASLEKAKQDKAAKLANRTMQEKVTSQLKSIIKNDDVSLEDLIAMVKQAYNAEKGLTKQNDSIKLDDSGIDWEAPL
jgi:predicted Zn-dependent protease